MHTTPKIHRTKLTLTFYLLSLACLTGLITIFISYLLIFFKKWPYNNNKNTCPNSQTYKFVNRIWILQIIYTVMIGLFVLCLLVLVGILLRHKYNVEKFWGRSRKFRGGYPLVMGVGLLAGVVALLFVIKFYVKNQLVLGQYNTGILDKACLTSTQANDLSSKQTPLIIIMVLISLMIFLTLWAFCVLPYRYFRQGEPDKYQQIVPLAHNQHKKVQAVLDVPVQRGGKLEISHQELLPFPVVAGRQYMSIGVGDLNVFNDGQVKREVQMEGKAVQAKPQLKTVKVGNHIDYVSQVTDCQGLTITKQYKNQSINTYQQIQKISNKIPVLKQQPLVMKAPLIPEKTVQVITDVPVQLPIKKSVYQPRQILLGKQIQMPVQKSILKPMEIPLSRNVMVEERQVQVMLPYTGNMSKLKTVPKISQLTVFPSVIKQQDKKPELLQILHAPKIIQKPKSTKNQQKPPQIHIQSQPQQPQHIYKPLQNMTPSKLKRLQRTQTKQVDPHLLTPRTKSIYQLHFQNVEVPENNQVINNKNNGNGNGNGNLSGSRYRHEQANSQGSQKNKNVRKTQNIAKSIVKRLDTENSSRRLVDDEFHVLRATKGIDGGNGIDWSHYNLLWAGERINKIYTPPKSPKEDPKSSKSSYKKWQQSRKQKK